MRDLEIWRRLVARVATTDDLRAVATLPLSRRVAYLAHVLPLVVDGEPSMRAAALRAIAGARGVEGVRAVVARLDDPEAAVRAAALEAMREVARDAPYRYVHALFHPRLDVRRGALDGELPIRIAELAVYLRADRELADLTHKARWPDSSFGLALDFYVDGALSAKELVEQFLHLSRDAMRHYISHAQARRSEVVDAFLDAAARDRDVTPAAYDVLDSIIGAIADVGAPAAVIEKLVDVVVGKRSERSLARRATVAVLGQLAKQPSPELWGVCVALEPRVLGYPRFDTSNAAAAAAGLFRHRWPTRPTTAQIERLLALPVVRGDLALAAGVAGLFAHKRLERLAEALGEDTIIAALVAGDHGWDELCRVPPEAPGLELAWLGRIAKQDYKRYVALSGRALGWFTDRRLEAFVEQMPRRHRPSVFLAAIAAYRAATDTTIQTIAKIITTRSKVDTLLEILTELLAEPAVHPFLLAILRAADAHDLASAVKELRPDKLERLIAAIDADPISRDREIAIANALVRSTSAAVIAWRMKIEALVTAPVVATAPAPRVHRALTPAERHKIATCSLGGLEAALEPVFEGHISGLCAALADRSPGASVAACNALLGCADPIHDVARMLDKFAEPTLKFDVELDNAAVRWVRVKDVPVLARARLWRWEAHSFALLDWIESIGSVHDALQVVDALPGRLARQSLWKAISEAVMLIRYRSIPRFQTHATVALARLCAERIDRDIGRHAARLLVALVESRTIGLGEVRDRMLDRIADADAEAREYLARLVRLDGIPDPPRTAELPSTALLEQIRASTDLDALLEWCRDVRPAIVEEAALALVVHGDAGQARLAALLAEIDRLAAPIPLLSTIPLWEFPPALDAVRALSRVPELPPAWQFHISVALAGRGEGEALLRAIAAVRAPAQGWYFRREDWDALGKVGDIVVISIGVADAPHHHAYQRALNILLSLTRPTAAVREALRGFLEVGDDRPLHLRVSVARFLAEHWKDPVGVALLAEYVAEPRADDWMYTLELTPPESAAAAAEMIVSAALVGGPAVCSEKRMWEAVQRMRDWHAIDADTQGELDLRIFEHAAVTATRRAASKYAVTSVTANARLRRVADVFAWGIRRGVELTGRLYRIHMTAKERELGHTKLDGSHIFISPLPMLRAETHGQDVVEGLVLHEIGHHMYHRSEPAQALWKQAHQEGIGHFLNLIADEHLERNLRARDPEYGDRLKRLGAYAFQHAPQEIKVAVLFDALGAATARAFTHAELEVAFDEDSVRVRRGAILGELDRTGHPVARFSRALRMGLGNRSGDPLIEKALAMCGKELRTLDMQGLYDLTKRLVDLFGGKHQVCKVFGGPEGLVFGDRDDDVFGAGVDDDILQREVERVLDPRRSSRGPQQPGNRLQLNVNPDTKFDPITRIVRVRGDAEVHRRLAVDVQRHSTRLRAYLDELGLRWVPQHARTQGRALDKTRLIPLVTRNDPRILVARNPQRRTDLFLGTLVDCSSSMTAGQNIERAKRFAVLVAEAVRSLPGVEARFFGFTDSVIYDAGNAGECGVVGLHASGGNNDAAALYHAANVALAARQRAKVLVMISDGLPTECSIAALRALVTQLTRRRNIICAQVAVRRLEEVCFPHHVLLDDDQPDIAVAKFGRMIGELARRSLSA
ncbi:MAG TPA: vWA domain-containing protein [Kofleriaceae bacterium]